MLGRPDHSENHGAELNSSPVPDDRMTDDDYRRAYYFALKVILCLAPVMALSFSVGRADLGRPACLAIGASALAIRQKWEFHCRMWFWFVVAGVALMHLPLLVYVVFSNRWIPAVLMMPFALADYVIMIGAIQIAAKHFGPEQTGE